MSFANVCPHKTTILHLKFRIFASLQSVPLCLPWVFFILFIVLYYSRKRGNFPYPHINGIIWCVLGSLLLLSLFCFVSFLLFLRFILCHTLYMWHHPLLNVNMNTNFHLEYLIDGHMTVIKLESHSTLYTKINNRWIKNFKVLWENFRESYVQ